MGVSRGSSRHVLLTRHFLRQFLENDLIAPDADRSLMLATVGAGLVSLTLCISVIVSANYLMGLWTPGQVAIHSLNDKFFYLAAGMIVTALVAASQWDALALDVRDAAILEPLPVHAATIRRAKVSAVAILGMSVAVAVNVCPTLVFPLLMVFTLRQMSAVALVELMAAHAIFTIAAAVFGYLAIIALRELLAAVLGPRWFARVSPWAQCTVIVMLGGSLLLLPPAAGRIGARAFDDWRTMTPPMWFLGAYELSVGGVIADLPRSEMRPRQEVADRNGTALYERRRPSFPALARRAAFAFAATIAVAVVAYLWNARRLPSLSPTPMAAFRRRWRAISHFANATLLRGDATQAGFYFTLAAMWRSRTHRLTLACAIAVGFAMAIVALSNANVAQGASPRLLSVQPLVFGALLVGFRHAIRVPAELRANWGFQLAWRGRERAYIAGVKRAAIVGLVLPAFLVLLPLFVFVLGPRLALMNAVLGLAGAIVLLEALMAGYDKVPFACTYLPSENMKVLAPVYTIVFLAGASLFARMQYDALVGTGMMRALLTLAITFACFRIMSLKRQRLAYVRFDEAPASFQRLGLDT